MLIFLQSRLILHQNWVANPLLLQGYLKEQILSKQPITKSDFRLLVTLCTLKERLVSTGEQLVVPVTPRQ